MDSTSLMPHMSVEEMKIYHRMIETRRALRLPPLTTEEESAQFAVRALDLIRSDWDLAVSLFGRNTEYSSFAIALRQEHPDKSDEEIAALMAAPWVSVYEQLFGPGCC